VIDSGSTVELENDEEELYEHYRFVVDPGQTVLRIDKFLIDRLAKTSLTGFKSLLEMAMSWSIQKRLSQIIG